MVTGEDHALLAGLSLDRPVARGDMAPCLFKFRHAPARLGCAAVVIRLLLDEERRGLRSVEFTAEADLRLDRSQLGEKSQLLFAREQLRLGGRVVPLGPSYRRPEAGDCHSYE